MFLSKSYAVLLSSLDESPDHHSPIKIPNKKNVSHAFNAHSNSLFFYSPVTVLGLLDSLELLSVIKASAAAASSVFDESAAAPKAVEWLSP